MDFQVSRHRHLMNLALMGSCDVNITTSTPNIELQLTGLFCQVENAIEIAWNPTSDQNLKAQAFDFLNQLRSDASGRQACVTLFTKTPKASEVVRLVCLDVVNNAIQTLQLDAQSLSHLK